jgi:O-antigen ligase
MNKKASQNKSVDGKLDWMIIFLWMAFPLAYSTKLYDGSYLPRHMFLVFAAIPLVVGILLFSRKPISQKWVFEMPVLAYFLFWTFHFLAATQAINPTEATFGILKTGSILVWFVLMTQALRSGLITATGLIRGIVVFSGISAMWAASQLITSLGSGDFWTNIYAVYQPFGHKNLVSGGLMLCLPFLGLAAIREKGLWRKAAFILGAFILLEIFVLRTRAAWFATLGGLGVVGLAIFLHKSEIAIFKLKVIGGIAAAGIGLMLVLVSIPSSGEKLTNTGNLENRFWFWENSVEMMREYPMGVGPGNWRSYLPKYGLDRADNRVQNGITTINRPHNDYLWVGSELGWGGLISYLLIFAFVFYGVHRLFSHTDKRDLALSLLFGVVSFMMFSITDFPLERAEHQLLLASMLALLCATPDLFAITVKLPGWMPIAVVSVTLIYSGFFMSERFQSGKAVMEVLQANERKDPMRIVPAVDKTISRAFNVDFYGNPILYFRGLGNNALKRYDEAEQDFLEALELHPHHIISMNQLGNVYKNQQRYQEALLWFNNAIEIAPEFVQARLNIAEIQIIQGQFNDAFITLRQTSDYGENPKKYILLRDFLPRFATDPIMLKQHPSKVAAILKYGDSPDGMLKAFMELKGTGGLGAKN